MHINTNNVDEEGNPLSDTFRYGLSKYSTPSLQMRAGMSPILYRLAVSSPKILIFVTSVKHRNLTF